MTELLPHPPFGSRRGGPNRGQHASPTEPHLNSGRSA